MRWWILDDSPILGGAELFALRVAQELRRAGDEVAIATPADRELASRAAEDGLDVLPVALPRLLPRNAPAIVRAVVGVRTMLTRARRAGAVVVANTAGAQGYVAVASQTLSARPPVIHLLHEQMTAARPSARWAFRRGGALVATGANTADAYRRVLPGREIHQLNNFVDADLLVTSAAPPSMPPVVGVLGRMIPEKGILELVDELASDPGAWARARIAAPPEDPAYARAVRDRVAAHQLRDRIDVLDWAPAIELLDAVDAVVVPSTGLEGQPTVILEALARGRPVVVRRPLWSRDFDRLPVLPYDDGGQLSARLRELPAVTPEDLRETARRFGREQATAALRTAAAAAGPLSGARPARPAS